MERRPVACLAIGVRVVGEPRDSGGQHRQHPDRQRDRRRPRLPEQLSTMGVAGSDRLAFVGLFGSLLFVLGMPLVPLWGVWADRYSRKAVIARSAIVEAVVFAGMALAREPWQVAVSMLLIGFQLGNTGVMLAGIRDISPVNRIGTIIAL